LGSLLTSGKAKNPRALHEYPSSAAKKFDKFRLVGFFYPSRRLGISSRRSRGYHQPLGGCISSRFSVHPPAA